ncbi:ABC transporter ATP-binding protein [Aminobacter aganoensis]|uniref:NitT/TauT family transport system ATP-binding protein n=1 Tax=Aminobacter aganoensis TaxID=83264 RepID=A0A7X0FAS2_9HYPH|nr:ABC transporter ATP-binding protein [Aminobacter aganoensis]MBB6356261.1 NitT/TauT family transport system ATP-binding protein [Aminobacter aganoensis]
MQLYEVLADQISHQWTSKNRPPTLAIDNVSCAFPAGKVTAIVGPSGCGKSTLLLILRGLIESTQGAIRFRYTNGSGAIVDGAPARMATVWQSFNLLPWRTVLDNVAFGLELASVSKEERYAKAHEAIKAVELGGFEGHFPSQLSGGMRQRVGLARGLVMSPDILLLDEPFGALDAQTRVYMQEQLAGLVETAGKTVILVTHSIEEAVFLSDHVIVMTARPGRVAATRDIPLPRPRAIEVQNDPRFSALFTEIYDVLRDEVVKSMMG